MGVVSSLLSSKSEGEDRLSAFPDDVLLCILGRVEDLRAAVRTSTLSTRWRPLPWLLPELDIYVQDFISDPDSEPIDAHSAMLALTKVTKSLFAKPRRESIVTRLQLKVYLIDTFKCDIGSVVCDAVDCGLLKELELSILNEKKSSEYSDSDILKRAQDIGDFFRAYPSVIHCLTRLSLYDVSFPQLDMQHILFDSCKQLKHLTLSSCGAGPYSVWEIDAPNSKISVLELDWCLSERIELISLPKLKKLKCLVWITNNPPLSFRCVPSLEELDLAHYLFPDQHLLKLSELLHGAAGIQTLRLDFIGSAIWLQPEIKQLAPAFRNLTKLFLLDIFVEYDLLWITAFLVAAPSIEILHIKVYEPCEVDHTKDWPPHRRTNPQWELDFCGSKNLKLRELQIVGFRPREQQLTFIRAMLKRAPNLQMVVLEDDEECGECGTIALDLTRPAFRKNEDERDMVLRRITDFTFFSGRVIFGESDHA